MMTLKRGRGPVFGRRPLGRAAVLALLFLSFPAAASPAAAEAGLLTGLGELRIGMGELGEQDRRCGLSARSRFELAARDRLERSGLSADREAGALFWIALNTLYVERFDLCVSHVGVEVSEYRPFRPRGADEAPELQAEVVLWRTETILSSDPLDHRARVEEVLDEFTFRFLSDWTKAQ
jgi:hypothetical protein